jgi:DNA-binding transcriptional ArsR family regulator
MRHGDALPRIPEVLSEVLQRPVHPLREDSACDALLQAEEHAFIAEYVVDASASHVGSGLRSLETCRQGDPEAIPLLVVPYMRPAARKMAEAAGVSWLDLSGNANIIGPGLIVRIEGRPDAHTRAGRPRSVFSPAATSVAMAFLLNPQREFTQTELAEETLKNRGTVSRHVRRFAEAGFIVSEGDGRGARWHVRDPDLMLDAWRAEYDFSTHEVRRGHVPGRGGMELVRDLAARLAEEEIFYAMTGLPAAWLFEPFAAFRLVTVYVPPALPPSLLDDIGFRAEPRGANTWLVHYRDEGVLMGSETTDGIRHVNPVQAYLDLKAHPERADEAAKELRTRMPWRDD